MTGVQRPTRLERVECLVFLQNNERTNNTFQRSSVCSSTFLTIVSIIREQKTTIADIKRQKERAYNNTAGSHRRRHTTRPISNLSVISKMLERLVQKQLLKYLKDNDLLPIFSRRTERTIRRRPLFLRFCLIYYRHWILET